MQHNVDLIYIVLMTDHAGPQRCEHWFLLGECECHPGTKFWHPPIEVTQFWHQRRGFGARFHFERLNKNKFISMKQNGNLTKFQQLYFILSPPAQLPLLLINIIFFWPYKQWAPEPLLGCQNFDGRVPKVSYRVTLATSGAGVVCHIYKKRHAFCTICIAI